MPVIHVHNVRFPPAAGLIRDPRSNVIEEGEASRVIRPLRTLNVMIRTAAAIVELRTVDKPKRNA
jgi:hypothetical protein